MNEPRDYYGVLQVPKDADHRTIDAAYWRLARESAKGTLDALAELNAAYEQLRTPLLRERYDAGRGRQTRDTLAPAPESNCRRAEQPPVTPVDDVVSASTGDELAYADHVRIQVRESRERIRARAVILDASNDDAGESPLRRIFGHLRAS